MVQTGSSSVIVGSAANHLNAYISYTIHTGVACSYTVFDSSTFTVFGSVFLAGGSAGVPLNNGLPTGAIGTLIVNGGTTTITDTLKPWDGGSITLAGGLLHVTTLDLSANPDALTFTSGILDLTGGSIFGGTTLTVPAAGTFTGYGTVNEPILLNGSLNVSSPLDPLAIHGTTYGAGTATISPNAFLIADALQINLLTLAPGSLVRIRPNLAPSKLNALSLPGTAGNWSAKLDLTASALIIQGLNTQDKLARIPTLANQITSAKNGNGPRTWTAGGITSSTVAADFSATGSHATTLSLFDNADLNLPAFQGLPIDTNSLIITRALLGDADLSMVVDAADFDIWFKHVGLTSSFRTSQGDLDLSGTIDAADFDLWFSHVGLIGLPLVPQDAPASIAASVPEPSALSTFLILLLLTIPRKKP
jgi:hypothetical protein